MEVHEERTEQQLILSFSGRIDTNTSMEFQNSMLRGLEKADRIKIDLGEVPYMSSAGLRAILVAVKTAKAKEKELLFCNIQEIVLEILEQSRFIDFMKVE